MSTFLYISIKFTIQIRVIDTKVAFQYLTLKGYQCKFVQETYATQIKASLVNRSRRQKH